MNYVYLLKNQESSVQTGLEEIQKTGKKFIRIY